MSRRSVLVLLAAGTVTACDRSAGCDGEFCGTLVVVQGVEPEPLFPPALQGVSSIALTDLMFLKLADLTSDMNTVGDDGFAPQLARSWTRADPTTVVFVMDPRARWHDGTPVSSHDVEFTFDVYRDTLIGSPKMPLLDRIVSVIATDSGHVEFKFTEAYPEQIYDAVYHMRILPAHLLEDIPRADLLTHQFARNPVGSGPYRFARWVPGEFVELQADSNFYLGRPSLRRVMWRITADKEAALLQLVAGEADAIETIRSAAEIERIRAASDLSLVEYPTSGYQYIQFNFRDPGDPTQPHPLFRTRELRRAIAMSIDVETVLMAVFGTLSGRAYGPVSQVLSIWSDTLPLPPYDTARARASLERLGWRDVDGDGLRERSGIPLRFELVTPAADDNRHRAAVMIQAQLRAVGIDMQVADLEFNDLIARVPSGRFDAFFGFRIQDPTPSTIREAWTTSGIGGSNFGSYSNTAFDDLVDRAVGESDPARALDRWHRAIAVINTDAPAVWLFSPRSLLAIHNRIQNVTVRPDQWAATMWTWRVPSHSLLERDRLGL